MYKECKDIELFYKIIIFCYTNKLNEFYALRLHYVNITEPKKNL